MDNLQAQEFLSQCGMSLDEPERGLENLETTSSPSSCGLNQEETTYDTIEFELPGETEVISEEEIVETEEQPPPAKKPHHTGKMSKAFMESRTDRQSSFYKRKETLLMKAEDIHTICRAEVYLKIKAYGSNKEFVYRSREVSTRNVKTQHGEPLLPPTDTQRLPTRSQNHHTPKKLQKRKQTPTPTVHHVPGKGGKGKKRVVATKKKVVGKCAECSIIWKSKADSLFCRKVGKRQGEWVGCDTTTCKYWAHVKCAGLILTPGKSIKNHSFFCKEHAS